MFHVLDTHDFPIQQLKLLLWGLLSVDPPGKSIMPYVVTTKVAEPGTPPSVHFAGRPELVAHTHILLPNLKKHISMFPRLSHLISGSHQNLGPRLQHCRSCSSVAFWPCHFKIWESQRLLLAVRKMFWLTTTRAVTPSALQAKSW